MEQGAPPGVPWQLTGVSGDGHTVKTSEERVLMYLRLVERYLQKPDLAFEPAYRNLVLNLLAGGENNDIFTLSFIAWLVARREKKKQPVKWC